MEYLTRISGRAKVVKKKKSCCECETCLTIELSPEEYRRQNPTSSGGRDGQMDIWFPPSQPRSLCQGPYSWRDINEVYRILSPNSRSAGRRGRGRQNARNTVITRMNLYYDRQDCLNHQRLRMDFWPEATTMQSKLYGTIGDLRRTAVRHHWWSPSVVVTGERREEEDRHGVNHANLH